MTITENTICPNQEDGRHRFHIYRIADVYEPRETAEPGKPIKWLEKVEYAYSGCNCGAARKTRIQSDSEVI